MVLLYIIVKIILKKIKTENIILMEYYTKNYVELDKMFGTQYHIKLLEV